MEQTKFKRRESELKDQLEAMYNENEKMKEELRKSTSGIEESNEQEEGKEGSEEGSEGIVDLAQDKDARIQELETDLQITKDQLAAAQEMLQEDHTSTNVSSILFI